MSNDLTIQCRKDFEKWILDYDPKALLTVKKDGSEDYAWIVMHNLFESYQAGWNKRSEY